ncbi:MAG TPA: hypothetical protein DHV85_12640, partial [Candidatus Accumulibacter sp.]|nr:hypothetical protein [Accumulibacter sp.]
MSLPDDITDSLRNNTRASLRIIHHELTVEDVKELAALLKTNTSVTELSVVQCWLNDEMAAHLAEALHANATLRGLYLSSNNIGPAGA